jgi:hypothetical protein
MLSADILNKAIYIIKEEKVEQYSQNEQTLKMQNDIVNISRLRALIHEHNLNTIKHEQTRCL